MALDVEWQSSGRVSHRELALSPSRPDTSRSEYDYFSHAMHGGAGLEGATPLQLPLLGGVPMPCGKLVMLGGGRGTLPCIHSLRGTRILAHGTDPFNAGRRELHPQNLLPHQKACEALQRFHSHTGASGSSLS